MCATTGTRSLFFRLFLRALRIASTSEFTSWGRDGELSFGGALSRDFVASVQAYVAAAPAPMIQRVRLMSAYRLIGTR